MKAHTIKAAVSPIDFYAHEQPTMPAPRRDHGWIDGGLCPFHADTRRGNFRVNLDTGAFKCFACEAAGGDYLALVQARDGLTFGEAVAYVADRWGIWAQC